MDRKHILQLYKDLHKKKDPSIFTKKFSLQLLKNPTGNKRPWSVSIEDAFFGDSGKGRITVDFNMLLGKKKKLMSLRYNGGANAGHECYLNGKQIVTHQLPIAIINEGATAIMGRGVVIHPQDLLSEITEIKKVFNGLLPATLLIDERAILSLDTHRALETVINRFSTGGKGSTGRGIATAYASYYERIPVTVKDLVSRNWKQIFTAHYHLYETLVSGFEKNESLATIEVHALGKGKHPVGNVTAFLASLEEAREKLRVFVSTDMYSLLATTWKDASIPFTFEGAQGAGLDPYHGVYPDVTASRPMSRFIGDTTYSIVEPTDIAMRVAVMKTTYMSSVGMRVLPTQKQKKMEQWIQKAFDEKGRSTGRLRDIYEVAIPIGKYLRVASGYDFLVATHLDASKENQTIPVITHYTHRKSQEEAAYLPYQDYLETLQAHPVLFAGWDGEAVKQAKKPADLPYETRVYLAFLSKTIAPVIFGTVDPNIGRYISWISGL